MTDKNQKKQHINIVTLGCSKNTVDSEHLAALLDSRRFEIYHDHPENTDIVIINTCGFVADAKEESVDTILSFANARKRGDISKLIVMGCLVERYKKQLQSEIHEVDTFMGVNDNHAIAKLLQDNNQENTPTDLYHYKRKLSTPKHYAYLKISEGCDRSCTFCAIPLIRGKHRSVAVEDLLNEARSLARQGVKELILIAQDLTYYGIDLNGKRQIVPLVEQLAAIEGIEWIRLQYGYPHGFPLELADLIREHPKLCKYIDLPLQHISDRILKSMKRGLDKTKTVELVNSIRQRVPGIAFRTTFIVGYPGETEEEFAELCDFIAAQRFERLGVFTYSPEEDTAAYLLVDDVPEETKQQRLEHIMEMQQQISLEINHTRIGSIQKTIIDRIEGDFYVGRTQYDSPEVDNEVLVPANEKKLVPGNFYELLVTAADYFDLKAQA